METLVKFVEAVNDVLWGKDILLFLLVGTGVWYTFQLGFIQVKGFTEGMKKTFGGLFGKRIAAGKDGMSQFQALATAIAAQVGTGNIAGAATAIAAGGPGAIFWMWISAFFGMSTIFAEATMAQKFKQIDTDGTVTGGPVYYIRGAYKGALGKVLAALFSIFIIFALGFMGNAVQSNSIAAAFQVAFGTNPTLIGIILAILAYAIFSGGIGRIAKVTETVVPLMAALYILGSLGVIVLNIQNLPLVFEEIFIGAFSPHAIAGGVIGATVKTAMSKGVARGLFSNEAGMGSTPHAHAVAKVKHPAQQGFVAMIGVFIDTFIVLNMTAFVIIITRSVTPDGSVTGAALAQGAFSSVYGHAGNIFIAICMFFFAFSTIIGWYFFGEANIRYLFGSKAIKLYSALVCICVFAGTLGKVELVWSMADMFNGIMVIPNLIGLLALTKLTKDTVHDYYHNFKGSEQDK